MVGTFEIGKLFGVTSSTDSVQRALVKVALFGGAAALCAYAGYRVYNSLKFEKSESSSSEEDEEEEDVWVLAPEFINDDDSDDDDSDDDDDAYETASEDLCDDGDV